MQPKFLIDKMQVQIVQEKNGIVKVQIAQEK